MVVFANVDFVRGVRLHKDYGAFLAQQLAEAKQRGAVGLKIPKALGLGYPTPDGKRPLPVDDPGLDPLFEKAGELDMPVAIHTGDPKAFWKPPTPDNERYDELSAHPGWSFYGESVLPSWEAAVRGVRAARGAAPEDQVHRRAFRQRARRSRAGRAHAG